MSGNIKDNNRFIIYQLHNIDLIGFPLNILRVGRISNCSWHCDKAEFSGSNRYAWRSQHHFSYDIARPGSITGHQNNQVASRPCQTQTVGVLTLITQINRVLLLLLLLLSKLFKFNGFFLNFIFYQNINLISCLYSNLLNKILCIEVACTLICTLLLYMYSITSLIKIKVKSPGQSFIERLDDERTSLMHLCPLTYYYN